ncbi:membrane protein PM19L [Salvia miltiorrhiza]|uniref:membrane protein PM19L n=1 Tax=Salvia miltiorrhiza TaxID=226208 RepID=UPI0025AB6764|nr:membrane protein PM19L [Salvia miltiorrhiza]
MASEENMASEKDKAMASEKGKPSKEGKPYGASKCAAVIFLALNGFLYFVIVSIAAWAVNHAIDKSHDTASVLSLPAKIFPIYYPFGNVATGFVVIVSLIAGIVGFTTSITGIHNVLEWNAPNLHAAAASSLISCLLTFLAMGFACKEMDIGSTGSSKLRTLEILLILVSETQLFCTVAIHLGVGDV